MKMNNALKIVTASSAVVSSGFLYTFSQLKAASQINEDLGEIKSNVPIKDAKVAVIGSGIGGASSTYFLRKVLGPSAQIDVYEKSDHIGGRLDVITLNGQTMESGGTFILNSNRYMLEFLDATGLEKNRGTGPKKIGVYDGDAFTFITTSPSWKNKLKMVWRYGPFSMWRLNNTVKESFSTFKNIYTLQDQGEVFGTVPEMLEAMGGKQFVDYTQKSCKEVMLDKGIGERFINEFATGMLRWHYGQSADNVNGIAGLYSLTGSQAGGICNFKGGNYRVCQELLQQSSANVHLKSKIIGIRKQVDKDSSKTVYYLEGSELDSTPYDVVIVAAPLEIPSCYLTCNECKHWPDKGQLGKYQKVVTSFVQAYVNFESFGIQSPKEMADIVLTTENKKNQFSALVPMATIDGKKTEPAVFRVSSRDPLSKDTILNIFQVEPEPNPEYSAISWLASPRYQHPEKFLPFQLDDGVFFVNAMERIASNMEMSAIGSRNAAMLTCKYLKNEK